MISENKEKLIINNEARATSKRVDLDGLISLMEASTLCNYSQEYLSLMARKGKIGAIKKGRNWVISRRVLLAYVEEHKSDAGGNNRGEFSEQATPVVKIYKQEKILSAFSVAKIKEVIAKPKEGIIEKFRINKNFATTTVLTLAMFAMLIFGDGSVLVKDLFSVTVIRGAKMSYKSLTEAKNVAIQMRRYISGESRTEISIAKNIFFSGVGIEINKNKNYLADKSMSMNRFIEVDVVEPQFKKIVAVTKYLPFDSQSFNLLKWNLNYFPESFIAMEKTIISPSSKIKNDLAQAFGSFNNNAKYAFNKKLNNISSGNEESVTPRVAGVQERVGTEESNDNLSLVQRIVNVVVGLGKELISLVKEPNN